MNTFEKISKIIAESLELSADGISPDTTPGELGLDSIDLVDLVMEIEDEIGVSIPDEEFETIKTIEDIVNIIEDIQ